ncbi:MAG: ROK family protein [Cyclobacteriaceae bacterium]|nr:ROK family protein [Cyclobacteriaceae bacterium]
MTPSAIAIDLGGTAIKYGVVTQKGEILWEQIVPTPDGPAESIIGQLIRCVEEAKHVGHPTCVGIGTPGLVDIQSGTVLGGAPQLPDWKGLPLATLIEKETGLPVFVDNDANLMGLGEFTFGTKNKGENVIFVTIGTGIGGAIILNGDLYRGHYFAGSELGCIPYSFDGKFGYWEDFASTGAMVNRYQALSGETGDQINGKYIFQKAREGNATALQVIHENTTMIGHGIGGLINIFNPERVIIGGGISEAGKEYVDEIKKVAVSFALDDCANHVQVCAASLGNKAGFLGAGYFALSQLQRMQNKPLTSQP